MGKKYLHMDHFSLPWLTGSPVTSDYLTSHASKTSIIINRFFHSSEPYLGELDFWFWRFKVVFEQPAWPQDLQYPWSLNQMCHGPHHQCWEPQWPIIEDSRYWLDDHTKNNVLRIQSWPYPFPTADQFRCQNWLKSSKCEKERASRLITTT